MINRYWFVLVFLYLSGCVSVPQESVQLSYAVGERIKDMQLSHESFVTQYFTLTKERLNDYIDNKFTPLFLEKFVRNAGLMQQLNSASPFSDEDLKRIGAELDRTVNSSQQDAIIQAMAQALGDKERGAITLEFAQAALNYIERERKAVLQPLDVREAEALRALRGSYTELISMQTAVTAHLQSIHSIKLEQDKLLERLNLLKKRDAALERAVSLNENLLTLISRSESVESTLERIKCTITKTCQ